MPPNNQQQFNQIPAPAQAPIGVPQTSMPAPVSAPQTAPAPPSTPMQAPTGTAQNPQAAAPNTTKAAPQTTTQRTLLFSELRDNMVIMNDGSFRAVVACQSINFDLMSDREREGVEYSYQNFLNALYFPVQILVRSQRVDIGPYLERLDTLRRDQDNMLLNILMEDYINFVGLLAEEANIMDKSFFVVIPYYPVGDASQVIEKSKGFFNKIFAQQQQTTTISDDVYMKAKEEIGNRVNSVMSGLFQIGIQCSQLNTKQLGELYYNAYNPDTAVREPLGDFTNNVTTYVRKAPSQNTNPQGVGNG